MIRSICIVRLSALGDVLMLVPLIRTLQKNIPHAHLTWIISKPAYDLVAGMNDVEFIVIDKPQKIRDFYRFYKQLQSRHFDVLLAPQASFRTNLLYPLIKATRKIGYDALRAKDGHGWFIKERIAAGRDHTLEGFLKFADVLGPMERDISWNLPIAAEDYTWASQHLPYQQSVLAINAASSKPERSWPAERYIEVIRYVQHHWNINVVLVGGPSAFDKELAHAIVHAVPSVANLVGQTKPKQLLALISQVDAILCPDTGPSHMAVAVNTPVVALHAVTNPWVSGPYNFQHLVVNQFPPALKKVLGQEYHNHQWGTHVHGQEAMLLITVKDVLGQLAQALKRPLAVEIT